MSAETKKEKVIIQYIYALAFIKQKIAENLVFLESLYPLYMWVISLLFSEREENFEYNLHGYGKVTESTGAIGEKQFDSLGRLMWMKSPDAGKMEYVYNTLGLVTQIKEYGKTESDYRTTNIIYDTLNRISKLDYDGTANDVDYEYYPATADKYARSSIKSITKGDYFKVEYEFGQLWINTKKTIKEDEDSSPTYSTKYEYDVQGRINKLTYPDNEVVIYSYNEGGFLNRIEGSQVYVDNIKYDKYGQRTYLKYGNGSEMTYTYNENTQLLDIFTTKNKNGVELLKYDYDFSISSNLTKISDITGDTLKAYQNYSYDNIGRMTHADGDYKNGTSTFTRNYEYDNDNRILKRTFEGGMTYTYNYLNGTHAVSNINITGSSDGRTSIGFTYDDYGNMLSKKTYKGSAVSSSYNMSYDVNNRINHIDLPDGMMLEMKYDNAGDRIIKEYKDSCGIINKNIYVNQVYTVKNSSVNKHISDGNNIIISKINNSADEIVYYHSNHLGSTSGLTNKDSNMIQSYLYYPFGETWITENPGQGSEIDYLFTGQELDGESGIYYFKARYYLPDIGVFNRPDPAMDGLNHYAYCAGNPIMYNDPTGLTTTIVIVKSQFNIMGLNIWIGTHAAVRVDNPKEGIPMLYDPAGSYKADERGSGGFLVDKDADLDAYKSYHEDKEGENNKVETYDFDTTPDQEAQIADRIVNAGDPRGLNCAKKTSEVIKGIGAFKNLKGSSRPGELASQLKKLQEKIKEQMKKDVVNDNKIKNPVNIPKPDIDNSKKQNGGSQTTSGGNGSTGNTGKSGGKIICTELYHQGLMDETTFKADQEFGRHLAETNPKVMMGYHYLATPVVKLMKRSKVFTNIVKIVAMPWAKEMSHQMGYREKGDFTGKVIMAIGMLLCSITGNLLLGNYSFLLVLLFIAGILLIILYLKKRNIVQKNKMEQCNVK